MNFLPLPVQTLGLLVLSKLFMPLVRYVHLMNKFDKTSLMVALAS